MEPNEAGWDPEAEWTPQLKIILSPPRFLWFFELQTHLGILRKMHSFKNSQVTISFSMTFTDYLKPIYRLFLHAHTPLGPFQQNLLECLLLKMQIPDSHPKPLIQSLCMVEARNLCI